MSTRKTRSRLNSQSMRENDEAANAIDGTNGSKKRKVNPSNSPRRTKRSNNVTKVDAKQTKSKQNLDSVLNNPKSSSNDTNSTNTRKSPRKLNRTNTVTKSDAKHTKSKPMKSKPLVDDTQNESMPITENNSEAHAFYNAIQQVLAANYVDVPKRLKLLYPTKCIQSLTTCRKEHIRNLVRNYLIFV